ncbi:MAG TPA: hypothetical protein VGF40_10980, partial [Thermoanaerobaculia bacterium]
MSRYDRAPSRRADDEWLREAYERGSFLLFHRDSFLLGPHGSVRWTRELAGDDLSEARFLGEGDEPLFSLAVPDETVERLTAEGKAQLRTWRELVGEHHIDD